MSPSFSTQVKKELEGASGRARAQMLAELAALYVTCGSLKEDENGGKSLHLDTENEIVARKCFTLCRKSLKVYIGCCVRMVKKKTGKSRSASRHMILNTGRDTELFVQALKITEPECVSPLLIRDSSSKRAALRGYFLSCGRMNDPQKGYHLEMTVPNEKTAQQIKELMSEFSLEGKTLCRKNHYCIYLKESESIGDFLKVIEAPKSLLEFENARIYKDMRGRVNRKVNCEAANINKTVSAAARQREDILLIEKRMGLSSLSEELRQTAMLRLEYPDMSLLELGKMCDPPIGKSGVNHRLRNLSELADKLRQEQI